MPFSAVSWGFLCQLSSEKEIFFFPQQMLKVMNDLLPPLKAQKLQESKNGPSQYFISVVWQVQSVGLLHYINR